MILMKFSGQKVAYNDLFVTALQYIQLVFILGSKSECQLLF